MQTASTVYYILLKRPAIKSNSEPILYILLFLSLITKKILFFFVLSCKTLSKQNNANGHQLIMVTGVCGQYQLNSLFILSKNCHREYMLAKCKVKNKVTTYMSSIEAPVQVHLDFSLCFVHTFIQIIYILIEIRSHQHARVKHLLLQFALQQCSTLRLLQNSVNN